MLSAVNLLNCGCHLFFKRITFPNSVQRITIEFDPRCCTAQPEDSLRIYIPYKNDGFASSLDGQATVSPFIPVLERFSGASDWPQKAVVLPGNVLIYYIDLVFTYKLKTLVNYCNMKLF